MQIRDPASGERSGKDVAVELRICPRARNGPHVDKKPHLRGRQERHELFDRTEGMSDGEERVHHSPARLKLSPPPLKRRIYHWRMISGKLPETHVSRPARSPCYNARMNTALKDM